MEAEFWHERWANNQIGFHLSEVNPSLIKAWQHLTPPEQPRIFVPLCGKTTDLLFLAEQELEVVGSEINPRAVGDFYTENKLHAESEELNSVLTRYKANEIEIILGDFFELDESHIGEINMIYDRAALIALPPEMRIRYAQKITSLLGPGMQMLLITLAYDQALKQGPPFSVTDSEVEEHYGAKFIIKKLFSQETVFGQRDPSSPGIHMVESTFLLTKE